MEGSHPDGTTVRGAVPRPVSVLWEASVSHSAHIQDLILTPMHHAINLLLSFKKFIIMENLAPKGLKKKVFSKCLRHLENYTVFKRM